MQHDEKCIRNLLGKSKTRDLMGRKC